MGLMSDLAGMGLGNFVGTDIYADSKEKSPDHGTADNAANVPEEKDFIFDKSIDCPVCGKKFTTKIMKTGKAKLVHADKDLRPVYEGVDATKYDVQMCTHCGYTALSRFFPMVTAAQAKLIKENISSKVVLPVFEGETYSYEDVMKQYQLALACAVVKRSKNSERAYICLKSAWLMRGHYESILHDATADKATKDLVPTLKEREKEYLLNAYNGFVEARKTESYPMCGMDENTIEYLVAVLAIGFKKYDVAGQSVSAILTSLSANSRMKDKARELKEEILEALKKTK